MKTLFLSLMIVPMMMVLEEPPNLGEISKAIGSGDAAALGQYFDETVEIAILDEEDMYSKSQAIAKVKSFFDTAKPKSFSQVHQGTSKGQDSQYSIGNLVASNGNYRVYIYLKVSGGKTIIQELRFDRS